MAKNKGASNDKAKSKTSISKHEKGNGNQRTIKKNASRTTKRGKGDNNKIHYVLNPKKIKEKMMEVKETERREKEKSYQKEKRKRNSAFSKTTLKGQPVLNARMKILYNQIQKSYGPGDGK